jgi:hypothetical protein
VFLLSLLEADPEMDLAHDVVLLFGLARLKLEPGIVRRIVFDEGGAETNVSEEGFLV